MKKYAKYIIGALLIVGVLGGAAVAYAAQGVDFQSRRGGPGGPGRGPGFGGEVIAVDGSTIQVQNPHGEEGTIVTNDATEFIVNGEAGSLADVAVGKFVMAMGERQDDGSVLAERVMVMDEVPTPPDGPRGPGRGPHVGGEVASVDGNTIKVKNPRDDSEDTIVTNDQTEFIVNGEAGSLDDVAVGKFVGAHGEMQDDGSILADRVMVTDEAPVPPGRPGRGPHVGGEVTAVDGNTIKVKNPRDDNEGTIVTNDETEFIVNGEAGSLADVTVGKFVGSHGEMQEDGSLLADRVMVMDEAPAPPDGPGHPGRGPHVGGEVTGVEGNIIKVKNPRGEGTIITNDETEFIVNGQAGSLADVAVGKFVGAGGEMQDDGSILADRVVVMDELPTRPERSEGAQGFFPDGQPGGWDSQTY